MAQDDAQRAIRRPAVPVPARGGLVQDVENADRFFLPRALRVLRLLRQRAPKLNTGAGSEGEFAGHFRLCHSG